MALLRGINHFISEIPVKDGEKSIENLIQETGIEVLGKIPEDGQISQWDLVGKPIIDLPETSPSVVAIKKIMKNMNFPFSFLT